MKNWDVEVVKLERLKKHLAEAQPEYPWRYHAPRPGCNESELAAIERSIGQPLDEMYREFLRVSNGWVDFFSGATLFGTPEYLGDEFREAVDLLGYAELGGLDRERTIPIAAAPDNINIFATYRVGVSDPSSAVLWLAGYEVETYPDFAHFFDAVVESYEEDLRRPAEDRPY